MAEVEILVLVKNMICELSLWYYAVLLVILLSSLYSLHMLYCNELSALENSYWFIFHYFHKKALFPEIKILNQYLKSY